MRVLITGTDLFRTVGGGQTYYRGVIARNPHVDFFYLRDREPADAARPPNAHPVAYAPVYSHEHLRAGAEPGMVVESHYDFLAANNIAHACAAAGLRFDVVDTPDYDRSGVFLREAFRRHGVPVGRVALAMHGAVSTTIALNWGGTGEPPAVLARLEKLQYAGVDTRYFISPAYRDEWRPAAPDVRSHLMDPMAFFTPPAAKPYRPREGPPDLRFIGRTERRKGPHYFVQLLWWLPRDCYREASLIGPESVDPHGVGSGTHLQRMIDRRGLTGVTIEPAMTADQMAGVFAAKSVVFATAQNETLNLVALESLFSGCPVVAGSGAGVCRYLRERFPGLPFTELDGAKFYAGVPAVERVLRDYDAHRAAVAAAAAAADLTPAGPSLEDVYAADPSFDPAARVACDEWYRRVADANRLAVA